MMDVSKVKPLRMLSLLAVYCALIVGAALIQARWGEHKAAAEQTRAIQEETAALKAEWHAALQPVCEQWRRVGAARVSPETNQVMSESCSKL